MEEPSLWRALSFGAQPVPDAGVGGLAAVAGTMAQIQPLRRSRTCGECLRRSRGRSRSKGPADSGRGRVEDRSHGRLGVLHRRGSPGRGDPPCPGVPGRIEHGWCRRRQDGADRTGIHEQPQLGPLLGPAVDPDVVSEPVVEPPEVDFGVRRNLGLEWRRSGIEDRLGRGSAAIVGVGSAGSRIVSAEVSAVVASAGSASTISTGWSSTVVAIRIEVQAAGRSRIREE